MDHGLRNTEDKFIVFCSLSGLTRIEPSIGTNSLFVIMSVGTCGSLSPETKSLSSSTFPAQPNFDGGRHFAMPWGNFRPVLRVNMEYDMGTMPPITLKLVANGLIVGEAEVPIRTSSSPNDINEKLCGKTCQIRLKDTSQKTKSNQFVALLHTKMWFGKAHQIDLWKNHIEPAGMQSVFEIFEVQKKGIFKKWNSSSFWDGHGNKVKETYKLNELIGEESWFVVNSKAMYVDNLVKNTIVDRILQIETREKNNHWRFVKYVDFKGNVIDEKYWGVGTHWSISCWNVDTLFNDGDEYGWSYFEEDLDFEKKTVAARVMNFRHKIRARSVMRTRTNLRNNVVFDQLRNQVGNKFWEFSNSVEGPYHTEEYSCDRFRRRRYIRKIDCYETSDDIDSRIYEVQFETIEWELQCRIQWKKHESKEPVRLLIKVSILHQTKQMLMVMSSKSLTWTGNVHFSSVFIAGGIWEVRNNPPLVLLDVVRCNDNNEEIEVLRALESHPIVRCSSSDPPGTWTPVLGSEDMLGTLSTRFQLNKKTDSKLPFTIF